MEFDVRPPFKLPVLRAFELTLRFIRLFDLNAAGSGTARSLATRPVTPSSRGWPTDRERSPSPPSPISATSARRRSTTSSERCTRSQARVSRPATISSRRSKRVNRPRSSLSSTAKLPSRSLTPGRHLVGRQRSSSLTSVPSATLPAIHRANSSFLSSSLRRLSRASKITATPSSPRPRVSGR